MTSFICNTSRPTSFHMIRRGRSYHETLSVPRHCAKHITPGDESTYMYRQQTKTKVSNKEHS
jgi:hypothetical protein